MARRILTERMWQRLATMLPPEHGRQGRPAKNNRQMLEAMLWRLRTGTPWRALSPEWGPWGTVYRRFERWSRAGIWQRVLEELVRHADEEWLMIDATVVRAHKSFPVQS
ncbi:MAG: IS5 family transposase [Nitrococcus sp.]|nr:IS5 family transposase [Nitrococcus sp.]